MRKYLSLIKFSHTIFAMPFALLGFFLALHKYNQPFDPFLLVLVVLCMVFARSAAMAFNRYLDRDIDQLNPRTAMREIPAGIVSARSALWFTIFNAVLFVVTTWFINRLCFYLSTVALAVVLGYSYTKRFTHLCHFVLGLGLSLAPIGAYLAAGGGFDRVPLLYGLAVLLWVSGFDIIYALQDDGFDKTQNLKSLPVALGRKNALLLSKFLHLFCAVVMFTATWQVALQYPALGYLSWIAVAIFTGLLFYQHALVKPDDLSKVNLAFFTTNGFASLIFVSLLILDLYF